MLINNKFISLCNWFEITCDILVWDYFVSMIHWFMQLLLCFCGSYLLSVEIISSFFFILLFLFILYRFIISSVGSLAWLYYFSSFVHLTIWVHNLLFYYTIYCFHLHHTSHFTACFTNYYYVLLIPIIWCTCWSLLYVGLG